MIGIKANISSTFIILRVKRSVDMKLIYLTLVSLPLVLLIDAGKSLSVCSYLTQFSFFRVSNFCLTFRVVVFLFSVLSVVSSVVSFRRRLVSSVVSFRRRLVSSSSRFVVVSFRRSSRFGRLVSSSSRFVGRLIFILVSSLVGLSDFCVSICISIVGGTPDVGGTQTPRTRIGRRLKRLCRTTHQLFITERSVGCNRLMIIGSSLIGWHVADL